MKEGVYAGGKSAEDFGQAGGNGVVVYFIYKALMAFSSTMIDWAMGQFTSNVNLSDATVQLTGLAAWLADTLMLSQTISLLISFCVVRFIIGIVRG